MGCTGQLRCWSKSRQRVIYDREVSREDFQVKLSARNQLKGRVKSVTHGSVNSVVVLELPGGVEIVSMIPRTSAEALDLQPGNEAYAVIKASNVMLAID